MNARRQLMAYTASGSIAVVVENGWSWDRHMVAR